MSTVEKTPQELTSAELEEVLRNDLESEKLLYWQLEQITVALQNLNVSTNKTNTLLNEISQLLHIPIMSGGFSSP